MLNKNKTKIKEIMNYKVTIEGVSPLLINRFGEDSEVTETIKRSGKKDYGTPREQAEKTAYKDDDGTIWIPSVWLKGAITTISSDYKVPGSRKSLKSIIGGTILPVEEKCYFQPSLKIKDIEVDSRPVVIQRARVMRHRARIEKWRLSIDFFLDESLLDEKTFNQLICESGKRAGIGDYRPQKGGPFGRFVLVEFKKIK